MAVPRIPTAKITKIDDPAIGFSASAVGDDVWVLVTAW
jgi:hypothetical protein